jgi:hypothetical protein
MTKDLSFRPAGEILISIERETLPRPQEETFPDEVGVVGDT